MAGRIVLHGRWMWVWFLWIASFLLWMIYGKLHQDFLTFHRGLCFVFTAWFVLEIAGAADLSNDSGTEKAKTLSQFAQYVSIHMAKPVQARWGFLRRLLWVLTGWNALVVGFAALVSIAAGILFAPVHPAAGILAGVTVFAWNVPHWLWRHLFG